MLGRYKTLWDGRSVASREIKGRSVAVAVAWWLVLNKISQCNNPPPHALEEKEKEEESDTAIHDLLSDFH